MSSDALSPDPTRWGRPPRPAPAPYAKPGSILEYLPARCPGGWTYVGAAFLAAGGGHGGAAGLPGGAGAAPGGHRPRRPEAGQRPAQAGQQRHAPRRRAGRRAARPADPACAAPEVLGGGEDTPRGPGQPGRRLPPGPSAERDGVAAPRAGLLPLPLPPETQDRRAARAEGRRRLARRRRPSGAGLPHADPPGLRVVPEDGGGASPVP